MTSPSIELVGRGAMVGSQPDAHLLATLVTDLKEKGLLAGPISAQKLRMLTHMDVDRAACEQALEAMRSILKN